MPKTIGIISGAGPRAGVYLLDRLLCLAQEEYGCCRDRDFPKILLLSYPFSEMLTEGVDITPVKQELQGCLTTLRSQGASVLAIACNTLHSFLEGENPDLVSLPELLASKVAGGPKPLVLCTSTSVRFQLHRRHFPCIYLSKEAQRELDRAIDEILSGEEEKALIRLNAILQQTPEQTILLGCTELSQCASRLKIEGKKIIEPLEIAARKILEKSFITN